MHKNSIKISKHLQRIHEHLLYFSPLILTNKTLKINYFQKISTHSTFNYFISHYIYKSFIVESQWFPKFTQFTATFAAVQAISVPVTVAAAPGAEAAQPEYRKYTENINTNSI